MQVSFEHAQTILKNEDQKDACKAYLSKVGQEFDLCCVELKKLFRDLSNIAW